MYRMIRTTNITTYNQLPEFEIIARINDGDIALFEILIRRYNPYLYKIGRSYGFNHHDVQDLMQEAFIKSYQNLNKLENAAYFKTWLVRIMLNECYRKRQKSLVRKEIAVDTFSNENTLNMFPNNSSNDTEKKVVGREMNTVIETAIKHIPLDYGLVFTLRELNGMSVAETANSLNITEANVKVRLNRAKTMLKKQVEKMYSAEDVFQFNLIYCDKIVEKVMSVILAKSRNN